MVHKAKLTVGFLAVWIGLQSGTVRANEAVQAVSDSQPFDRATFQADYDRVWQTLFKLLSDSRFEFVRKEKKAGQIETGYLIFSKQPAFSKLSNGVRTYANPPKAFLKKWSDGRIKVVAQLNRLSDVATQVILRPDIEGFAATRGDDTGVTGEWRQCRSNGKFESELLNDVATELRKPQPDTTSSPPGASDSGEKRERSEKDDSGSSDIIFQSIPEGAEIYLNEKLIGMTPTRLSLTAGGYKIRFRKAGYREYQKEFVLFPRSEVTIATEMEKESP